VNDDSDDDEDDNHRNDDDANGEQAGATSTTSQTHTERNTGTTVAMRDIDPINRTSAATVWIQKSPQPNGCIPLLDVG
jgi:hypothetical protein